MTPLVDFGFVPDGPALTGELCKQLVDAIFAGQEQIRSVRLDTLPDGHAGYSAIHLLVARPTRADGTHENPLLVRIGPYEAIEAERRRYDAYVKRLTGLGTVPQQPSVLVGPLAAVTYAYIRATKDQPPKTLRHFLADDETHAVNIDRACGAVTTLFRDTLAQAPQENGWYADSRTNDTQRALWFYNTILPPAITLQDARPVPQPEADIALTSYLASADSPIGMHMHGSLVFLQANAEYPHLRVVARTDHGDQCTLRLYLYEYQSASEEQYPIDDIPWGDQKGAYRRMRPLSARIDITGPAEALRDLPDNLDQIDGRPVIIQGRIANTRYAMLDDIRRQHFSSLLKESEQGGIICGNIVYDNPLRRYAALLSPLRLLTTSIVHGDLNLGNILLSQLANGETGAWLIDFDKTTNGGHAVFDAVKLETEFKIHVLPHWFSSVDDFLRLESALHQGLINPDQPFDFGKHEYLRGAYQFIAAIRRAALLDLKNPIPPEEYYLGLIAYGLAALKYPNLYTEESGRRPAKIKPLALAAYVSASFAASTIRQLDGVVVTAHFWAAPPPPAVRLIARPRVVGRDKILVRALRQLQSNTPVVLLHGPVGSGRGTLARYIGADLQRQGYVLWQDQPFQPHTVEEFIGLLNYRRQDEIREPSASDLPRGGTRNEDLFQKLRWLCHELESNPQPVVLLIRLPVADTDLRLFVIRLAERTHRTALVLIADAPLDGLPFHALIPVPPFDTAGVEEYIRRHDLRLDRQAVQVLHTATEGLPWLIDLVIEQARERTSLVVPLHQAVAEIAPAFDLERHLGERLSELSKPIRRLLELYGVLLEHAPHLLDNATSIEYEQLQRRVIQVWKQDEPALEVGGWSVSATDDVLLNEYHRYMIHKYPNLRQKLAARAYQQMASAPRQQLYTVIAGFYAGVRSDEAIFSAATFQALALRWTELAKSLLLLLEHMPAEVFSGHCHSIYTWATQVLSHASRATNWELNELAGDCAAYLGSYDTAIDHYNQAISCFSNQEPQYRRVLARLLPVYDALGEKDRIRAICEELLDISSQGDLIHALAIAYKGSADLFADPNQAAAEITRAINLVRESRESWGYEEKALWVRLHDGLALAQAYLGHKEEAIKLLEKVRPYATDMPALRARLFSNLAIIFYFLGDSPQDMHQARRFFKQALDIREALQDQVGIMRTAQNLANMWTDLATKADDWNKAEEYYRQAEAAAGNVKAIDQYRISANYMDLLIHRGRFQQAKEVFEQTWEKFVQANQPEVRDQATHILLLLNRAKLALWAGEGAVCQHYLDTAIDPIADVDQPNDKIEWAQIALEAHLRLDLPLNLTAVDWLSAEYELDEEQREGAELTLGRGLLALGRSDYGAARRYFEESYRVWAKLTYHFRAAVVLYWQVECAIRVGDSAQISELLVQAEQALALFGETPVLQRLRRWGNYSQKERR